MHNIDAKQDETETLKIITHRHLAWLTALRHAMRTKKQWEASYEEIYKAEHFPYHIPEFDFKLEDEIKPQLSQAEFDGVMQHENKPNAIVALQSKHIRQLTD